MANGSVGTTNYLYAADSTGHINVFDTNFTNVTNTTFAGKFFDPSPSPGFEPFGIQNLNGNIYVMYAKLSGIIGLPGGFGTSSINPNALYFTAGIDNQSQGRFGEITLTPEPGTITLLLAAAGSVGVRKLWRRMRA